MNDPCETCEQKDECQVEFIDYSVEARAVYEMSGIDGLIPWVLEYERGTQSTEVSEFYSRLNAAVLSTTADLSKVVEFRTRFNQEVLGEKSSVPSGMKTFLEEELPDMYAAIMSYYMDGWMNNSFKMFELMGAALDVKDMPFRIVTEGPEEGASSHTVH